MLNTIAGCSTQYQSMGGFRSDGVEPGLAGPDANGFLDVGDENLAVADPPGLRRAADGVDRPLYQVIADHDLDLHLGQKVDDVLRAAIEFGVAFLPSKTLGFGHGDPLQSHLLKRFFHLVELERLDDGFDFFTERLPGHFRSSNCRFVSGRAWYASCSIVYPGTRPVSGRNPYRTTSAAEPASGPTSSKAGSMPDY